METNAARPGISKAATSTKVSADQTGDVSCGVHVYVGIATLLLRSDVALTIETIVSKRDG